LADNVVFTSDQRVFALKRTAILRIEMLKQVQHDGFRTKNEQPGRVATERRTGLLGGGPLTDNVVSSATRGFSLKRTAVLRIEMLKQVQHDGFPDEELRTWTRSDGTKNGLLGGGLLADNVVFHQRPAGFCS
jgi:hypothetical protein